MEESVDRSKTPVIYHPMANLVTLLVVQFVVVFFAWLGLHYQTTEHFEALIPVLLIITMIGQRFAAPAIPWMQLVLLCFIILGVHLLVELIHSAPIFLLVDYVLEGLCVYGFGHSWVKKGYIPHEANHWH
jgi:hypothetical protein